MNRLNFPRFLLIFWIWSSEYPFCWHALETSVSERQDFRLLVHKIKAFGLQIFGLQIFVVCNWRLCSKFSEKTDGKIHTDRECPNSGLNCFTACVLFSHVQWDSFNLHKAALFWRKISCKVSLHFLQSSTDRQVSTTSDLFSCTSRKIQTKRVNAAQDGFVIRMLQSLNFVPWSSLSCKSLLQNQSFLQFACHLCHLTGAKHFSFSKCTQ